MHKEFLKLLEKAKGRSEYIIAVNLDVRGFTSFCQSVESVNVATYITKIYSKIINGYFSNASYYKPTGDGLIIIIPFTGENLKEVARSTINSCLDLLEKFGSLCINEAMINYDTPQKIGIGLTRGSACCIRTEDKVLDYSGRILNLASRLMDIARPSGIVFDDSFGIGLLEEKTRKLFSEETVYVRGVAEENPMKIYYTKEYTLLPDFYKQPLKEPKWNTDTMNLLFAEFGKLRTGRFWVGLDRKPLDESKIVVKFTYDNPQLKGFAVWHRFSVSDKRIYFEREGNKYRVGFNSAAIRNFLKEKGVRRDMNIQIDVIYPVK